MNLESYPLQFVKPLRLSIEMFGKCNIRFDDDDSSSLKEYTIRYLMLICAALHFASATKFIVEFFNEQKDVAEFALAIPIYGFLFQAIYCTTMTETHVYAIIPVIEFFLRKFVWHQEIRLRLPYPCSYPFDPFQNWLIYASIYVFQMFSALRYVYTYLGTEFLMCTLTSYSSTEFSLLQEDMRYVKPIIKGEQENELVMSVEDFVKNHQRLLKLSKTLDDIFNKINFVMFVFSTFIICFFAVGGRVAHGVMDKAINYFAVIGILVPIYIICHYGEMLRIESAGVADAAFDNLWYTRKFQYQKAILLIIMRSQRACCLTSLKCYPITLHTFTKVLSTTWSYFSLVTSLYEENN